MTPGGRVVVVGAGVIGCFLARRIAQSGRETLVLDAGRVKPSASAGSLCWLNAASVSDPDYAAVRVRSIRRWRAIAAEDAACPATFEGSLIWNRPAAVLEARAAMLEALGWPALMLDGDAAAEAAPGLAEIPEAALLAPNEGAAHPLGVSEWARQRAEDAGARFLPGTVRAVTLSNGRVDGLALDDATHVAAETVVLAAGLGCPALLASVDRHLPLREGAGRLLITGPAPPAASHVLAAPMIDLWRDDAGRVLATSAASKTAERADGLAADAMLDALGALVPSWRGLRAQSVVERERPIPADGLPAVGGVGVEGLWLACAHSGMTLAPAIADHLAATIAGAPSDPGFSAYAPERFCVSR